MGYAKFFLFTLVLFTLFLSAPVHAENEFSEALELNDDIEATMTYLIDYNGEFEVDNETAQELLEFGVLQQSRDELAGTIVDPNTDSECEPDRENTDTHKDFLNPCGPRLPGKRRFRLGYMMQMPANSYSDFGKKTSYSSLRFDNNRLGKINLKRNELNDMTLSEGADYLKANFPNDFSDQSQSEIISALAFDRIVHANHNERDAILAQAGEHMNFQDQINFIAKVGNRFSSLYDNSRAAQGVNATGAIDCNQLFDAQLSGNDAGVCRDMSICQAQLLEKMDPRNVGQAYAVSFASAGNYHVTTIATDPETGVVHKINYDDVITEDEKQGIAALDQSHGLPSVGVKFRMWDPSGKIVSELPEERYLLMTRMLGLNPKEEFDPLIREDYQVQSITAEYGALSGNIFMGRLSNGDQIMGAATNLRWGGCSGNENSRVRLGTRGSLGLGYTHQQLNTFTTLGDQTNQYSLHNAYLVLDGEVFMPIRVNDNLNIEPFVGGRLGFSAAFTEDQLGDDGNEITGDADMVMDTGVRIDATSDNNKHRIGGQWHTQFAPGLTDIRPLLGSNVIVYPNFTKLQVGYEGAVSGTLDDPKLVVFTNTMFILREPGNHFLFEQGIRHTKSKEKVTHNTQLSAGVSTPIGEQRQGWLPGGTGTNFNTSLNYSAAIKDGKQREKAIFNIGVQYRYTDPQAGSPLPGGHGGFINMGIQF